MLKITNNLYDEDKESLNLQQDKQITNINSNKFSYRKDPALADLLKWQSKKSEALELARRMVYFDILKTWH